MPTPSISEVTPPLNVYCFRRNNEIAIRVTNLTVEESKKRLPEWQLMPTIAFDIFAPLATEDQQTADALFRIPSVQRILTRLLEVVSELASAASTAATEMERLQIERELMNGFVHAVSGKDGTEIFCPPK